ncbi:aminopeptidase P family protein [Verrucomicrobia bacterium LW23]|nr:aminopeptidase P family protein [Verrucomicrobia bacterium LW23]
MKKARMMYGASDADADLLYSMRFFVPDPVLWWQKGGKTNAVFSQLEIDRARKTARVDRVWSFEEFLPKGTKDRSAEALAATVARSRKLKKIEVPRHFPISLVRALEKAGAEVKVAKAGFFPERELKSEEEIAYIQQAQELAQAGMRRAWQVLRESEPGAAVDGNGGPRVLQWGGADLTSQRLRGEIDAEIIRQGGLPAGTIVACADQACDPHERGSGPLFADSAIILDIFPRVQATGYFGDLTRTVVRGKASDELHRLYNTVKEGKAWVMGQVKAGVHGNELHVQLTQRFTDAGWPTEQRDGRWVGFFHGTGHSLGLEIHEAPRFSAGKFKAGQIMTIEPGLYFPGIGGVRIEDLVVITESGVRNLTDLPEVLEL